MFPLPKLLDVKVMQRLVLRLYSQAKEGRKCVSVVLHSVLTMEVSIKLEELVGK